MKNEVNSLLVHPSAPVKLSKFDPDTTFGTKKEELMKDLGFNPLSCRVES